MLETLRKPSYKLRAKMADVYDDDDVPKGRTKSRRELPAGAVATLKAWLLSPEHFTHPYPTPQDQAMLMQKTGIDKKQLKNWFTNARRRIWKPMLKKQIEQGKISATAPGTGQLVIPGVQGVAGSSMDNPHSVQAMRVHYQQALQDQSTSSANAVRCFLCRVLYKYLEPRLSAVSVLVESCEWKYIGSRLTHLFFFVVTATAAGR